MKITDFLYRAVVLFVGSDYFQWWFPVIFVLLFIAWVPKFIRSLMLWR